jgi:hydrogenase maturation protease
MTNPISIKYKDTPAACLQAAGENTLTKILVCGLGNKLKRDDGLGPHVIEELERHDLPGSVCLIDFGISGFKCALEIGDYDKVIFIDAIDAGKAAGEMYRIRLGREDLLESPSLSSFAVSLHESDLERILATAALLDTYPGEVVIFGCQPADISFGLGLSRMVKKAADNIINLTLAEVEKTS